MHAPSCTPVVHACRGGLHGYTRKRPWRQAYASRQWYADCTIGLHVQTRLYPHTHGGKQACTHLGSGSMAGSASACHHASRGCGSWLHIPWVGTAGCRQLARQALAALPVVSHASSIHHSREVQGMSPACGTASPPLQVFLSLQESLFTSRRFRQCMMRQETIAVIRR